MLETCDIELCIVSKVIINILCGCYLTFSFPWHLMVMKLREYVDDTEDYINIMLDDKQNHLLQMGVMLTTATLVVSCFVVVVGILGMNIKIELFKEDVQTGMPKFLWTVAGGTSGVVFLYVIAIAWCKHKQLLDN